MGICGFGTVGCGTFRVLQRNRDEIAARVGRDVIVTHIGARRDNAHCDTGDTRVSRDVFAVVRDPQVDIVVELIGGGGEDNIVFEADGGMYGGGATTNVDDDPVVDTLWLTANSYGTKDVASVIDGGVMRIDLGVGKEGGLDNFAGYGGADMNAATGNYTSDQSIYKTGYARAQVQDFESVIATGLGGIDYLAAGANKPELDFAKQQNFRGIDSALDLRGTNGANTLYAAGRDDKIEGRGGNDLLSGGEGVDDFVFNLNLGGDGLDVIWRQSDQNNDNLWDVDAAGKGNGALARIGAVSYTHLTLPTSDLV